MKYDAIIVLGEPINNSGFVGLELKSRLDEAIKIFKKKIAKKIIVTGGKTTANKKGISEAEGLKRYLVSQRISPDDILKEEYSKDTIGNALFSKIKILDPNKWKKILIVTSDYHMPRAKYIFKKLLGKKFSLAFRTAKSFLNPIEMEERKIREDIMIALDKIFLEEFHLLFLKE